VLELRKESRAVSEAGFRFVRRVRHLVENCLPDLSVAAVGGDVYQDLPPFRVADAQALILAQVSFAYGIPA